MIKPFIKWVGGKGQLLEQLEPHFPLEMENYVEPFLGGGSVLLWVLQTRKPRNVVVSDINPSLINAYVQVRDHLPALIAALTEHKQKHLSLEGEARIAYYLSVRAQVPQPGSTACAARFIYLNKTCFNGLYRVNQKGQFNVSMGNYAAPEIFDAAHLEAVSRLLQGVTFRAEGFHAALARVSEMQGCVFVYADPPYIPLSATSNFVGYADGGFDFTQQTALRDALMQVGAMGHRWAASNSGSPLVKELYAHACLCAECVFMYEVSARRAINCDPSKRGPVAEYVVACLPHCSKTI
jgi:DNA adenine methylase